MSMRFNFVVLACLIATSTSAKATSVAGLSLAAMSKTAQLVVRGVVIRTAARHGPGSSIFTDVTLRVERVLKGPAMHEVTYSQLGGSLDGATLSVDGMSSYAVGEEVVVFLEAAAAAPWVEIGVGTAKYRVYRSAGGTYVEHETSAVAPSHLVQLKEDASAPPSANPKQTLEEFEANVMGSGAR